MVRKMYDSDDLYLKISPSGRKRWRLKYDFDGISVRLPLGTYPDVSLKDARNSREEARKLLAEGIDPAKKRDAKLPEKKPEIIKQAANSFEIVTEEWFAKHSMNWSASYGDQIMRRMEREIFPMIGDKAIADISSTQLSEAIHQIEQRGALTTAQRALADCGKIFVYAVATGQVESNPCSDLRSLLSPDKKKKSNSAISEPKRVAEMLRALDSYNGALPVRCALRLAPLVFVRPKELRDAQWEDINLDTEEWRYIVTKTDSQHIVPLASQAVTILKELKLQTGDGRYVFSSAKNTNGDKPMGDNAIGAAMRRVGIGKDDMSGHGFRVMARTLLNEELRFRPDFINHQLAHLVRDSNGYAYKSADHLPERRKMMQEWADYLDKLKATT